MSKIAKISIRQVVKHPTADWHFNARDVIGWYGVLSILAAYGLLSFKVISADTLPYQLLNLTGAAGIMYEAAAKKDVQPVALNIVWALVAVVAILRIII